MKRLQVLGEFRRVSLEPGASRQVSVTIDPRLLADWKSGGWSMPGGDYSFAPGRDADELGPLVTAHMAGRKWHD